MSKKVEKTKHKWNLEKNYPWLLVIGGLLGLASSLVLTFDKIKIAQNPNYIPNCNFNPVISCGSVIKTWQASALGFPNSFMGITGFAVVLTIGMVLLAGLDAKSLKRWFWWGLNLGAFLGLLLVHWLMFQTTYRINALCPFCIVVWTVTIPIFWYTTLYSLRQGFIPTPARLKKFVAFLQHHHADILVLWFVIIIGLILNHFWYYWQTLL
jgi:uncharacterized membrane protein